VSESISEKNPRVRASICASFAGFKERDVLAIILHSSPVQTIAFSLIAQTLVNELTLFATVIRLCFPSFFFFSLFLFQMDKQSPL
jgi:phosphoglycerol transferase MdoB-like AlkP superfamily enzyme